jgi:nucleoside-diphosphate-sugar epimerase
MRAAITGTSGYVGSAIARRFVDARWEVLALSRRAGPTGTKPISFTLGGNAGALPWEGVNAVVHCAYDFRITSWNEIRRVNIAGSINFLQSAKMRGVERGIFISSLSCFEGCRSMYGKAKLEIESAALDLGYTVVRPGLVFGPHAGGTMGALARAAGASPVLPMIGSGRYPQYLVHEEDLAEFVFELCAGSPVGPHILTAAHPAWVQLKEIIRREAEKSGRRVRFIGIPWPLILGGLRFLEACRLPSPFRSDSLIGIVFQNPAPDFTLPSGLHPNFRPYES